MTAEHERLSLAVYALRKTGFRYGMHVFITGCDEIAYTLGTLANYCGAASVTYGVLDNAGEIREKQSGSHYFVYGRDDLKTAKKITGGRLFDIVYETMGNTIAYDSFIDMIKRGGVAGILARLDEPYSFFVKTAVRSQIRFVGIHSYDKPSENAAESLIEQNWSAKV